MKQLGFQVVRRVMAVGLVATLTLSGSGCASPQQAFKGMVDTGFDVAQRVVIGGAELGVEATKLGFKTAEAAGKGTMNALMK